MPDALLPGSSPESPPAPVRVADLYRQMWQHALGGRRWLLLAAVLLLSSQGAKLLVPWLTAQAIGTLQGVGGAGVTGGSVATGAAGGGSLASCLPWIGAIVAASAGAWLLHGPGRALERSVAIRVRRSLAERLFRHLSAAPLAWHEAHHSAELAHRSQQATQALHHFTQSQFVYLQSAANLVGPLVALTLLSGLIGGIALLGLGAVALTIVAFDRALMRLAAEENRAERRHAALLMDCLNNIATVLSQRLQSSTGRLLAQRLEAAVAPLRRSIGLNEWKWCAVDLLTVLLTWGLVVVYAWRSQSGGALLLGGVFMVHQYAQQASGVIGSLAGNLQNFARIRTDFASAQPLFDAPQTDPAPVLPHEPAPWDHIDLCGLGFEHPPQPGTDTAPPADARGGLRPVSLRLHAGERIALVGPSGSGKTTLLRLLAGLYTPTQGHLQLDGRTRLGPTELGALATLIPQEAQVFEGSVRENLAFDRPCADADLLAAARIGLFDAVLDTLPAGLDTPLTQAGANLSGGQRQRLGLARGVLAARGSAVLLLDEPTSALDPVSEAQVYERLEAAFARACIVASVHRMSLLPRFDRVVLMDAGRLVDCGTPQELAARQALFRELTRNEVSAPRAIGV